MKPTSPLYFDAADVLAAFSRECENEVPSLASLRRPEVRAWSAARAAASRVCGSVANQVRTVHGRWDGFRPQAGRAASALPATMVTALDGPPTSRDEVRVGLSYRPSLTSHFALVASAE